MQIQHMGNHKYYNFKQGVSSFPNLLTLEEIKAIDTKNDRDYYMSIFRYNDKHKDLWKRGQLNSKSKKNEPSVKGSEFWDVVTNVLVWDFDKPQDPEAARLDTVELAHRLVNNFGVDPEDMYVSYSGNKGFHLGVNLPYDITQEQFKQASTAIVKGLQTYDPSVQDPPRILRMEHTKNLKSGLFKIPLSIDEVDTLSIDEIKELAKTPRTEFQPQVKPVRLPDELFKVTQKKNELKVVTDKFDPYSCPKGWKPYKWALAEGWFDSGERHQALMIVAAPCRALGYDKDKAYYICKDALKKQAKRTGQAEFNKEELYKNIIEDSVYSDGWEGGSYGLDNAWVQNYCTKMGIDISKDKEESPVTKLDDLIGQFIDFSTNFEQNIIKTGITEIDENLMLCVGTLNGLLGAPGSGKTTVAMEILKNASLANIPSMFFSLDMGPQIVFAKVVQKETGKSFKEAMRLYREQGPEMHDISQKIKDKFKHVGFNFKCGSTVSDLKNYIIKQRELTGQNLKFVVVDYLELISGPYSDPNANAAVVVHALKNLATEENVCILLLLQTQKHSTPDIADPLLSMRQIKGSSAIEQDCSTVLTLWREGYSPDHIQDDHYISFALVKNRFDSLWRSDFHWEPVKGNIRSLTEEEWDDLEKFKNKKKQAKAMQQKDDGGWQ